MSTDGVKLPLAWTGDWLVDADYFYLMHAAPQTLATLGGERKIVPSPLVREWARSAPELEAALRAVILASLTDPGSESEPDPAYDPDAWGKATALLARIDAVRKATS